MTPIKIDTYRRLLRRKADHMAAQQPNGVAFCGACKNWMHRHDECAWCGHRAYDHPACHAFVSYVGYREWIADNRQITSKLQAN